MSGIPELQAGTKLLRVVEQWLREEKAQRRRRVAEAKAQPVAPKPRNPFLSNKHMMYYR